ncbi:MULTISPECIES: MarR family winged helix-turn-helix transcriptional regulator [unclassified Oceanobacter]|jgi:DNA-binding MarR family transcriptional regulator|uniref:MarR family winged helix-turn-helix transcriptional regulator n=1 Tax=unclassified Oceanobacter TaxID=2620260 RepID=UPI0026E4962C|nr:MULTISPECIES: MarR family transcriptional regulator [unclassified Oceanobacter]MDO6680951.1 MarR family transcriptional regulator [Oceanobacter sp. 5_MG-2023]MDP2504712.1 MarR family transcriptional regulator [Oceanobacter sp. 3_MG-2023]MDP2546830.1 MarR family transcriptional regulator [Oceanobacter sp. 4_MG-2023]MDP2607657.1 MarR family transcriptional regulator [Oceanobacter sp. 1_MG-2023]MDP2611159.1 MarR family transcriptional regulator [Oceanobacter sp. 2_MG-2023]
MKRYDEVLVALRRIIRATDLHSKQLSKTSGLTAPQLLILQTLRHNDDMTVGEVARKVSLSQATVTTIIDRLEKRGYVVRERGSQDKRKVYVHLTEDAQKALLHAPRPLQESFIRQFQDLQEWEQTMILSSLERVAYMMDAQHIDASPVLDVGALDRIGNNASTDLAPGNS